MFNFKFGLGVTAAAAAGALVAYRLLKPQKAIAPPPVMLEEVTSRVSPPEILTPLLFPTLSKSAAGPGSGLKLVAVRSALTTAFRMARVLAIGSASAVVLAAKFLTTTTKASPTTPAQEKRFKLTVGLMLAMWLTGLVGHFTPLKEWPAVFLYVLGTLGLAAYLGKSQDDWKATFITRENLKSALIWGGLIGSVLFGMDVSNTYTYYSKGGAPMKEMEEILVRQKFLYLFPVLIIAEEFLWRGLLFSALLDRGMNKHKVVALTTLVYVLNHYAVAPVGFKERTLMAVMAVPIGFANGYMTLKTKNLWSGVVIHGMTMLSMTADLFVIPKLVKARKATPAS